MDKREHHQQQKMKQIYLTAQKAALAARLMALKHKIKNQNDGEEIQVSNFRLDKKSNVSKNR
jgi:biotin synthase-like enzyme